MVKRRLSRLYDSSLALFGVVRPPPPLRDEPAQRPATPAEIDQIARQLGFVVSEPGFWRSESSVVVAQLKSRDAGADNDLPDRVVAMQADGRIRHEDRLRAMYIYEENTPAIKQLFDTITNEARARPGRPFLMGIDALRHLGQEVRTGHLSQADARNVLLAEARRAVDDIGP